MSLTSLLRARSDLVAALVELVPPGALPLSTSVSMLAYPVTDHHALVGTAFDYLFRFEVQRRFPRAKDQRWVAETAVEMMNGSDGGDELNAQRVVNDARRDHRLFLRARAPGVPLVTRMAEHSLRLAKLDSLYRSGNFDPTFAEASQRDVRDLLRLLSIVPFDGKLGALLREGPVVLNPTFGKFSGILGGADADLVAGGALIDLKVTQYPGFKDEHLAQILGYSMLGELYQESSPRQFPVVRQVGLYFARHGVLALLDLMPIRANPNYHQTREQLIHVTEESLTQPGAGPNHNPGNHREARRQRHTSEFASDHSPSSGRSVAESVTKTRSSQVDESALPGHVQGSAGGSKSRAMDSFANSEAVPPAADPPSGAPAIGGSLTPPAPETAAPSVAIRIDPTTGELGQTVDGVTEYHAKFFANEITRLALGSDLDRISQSLFDACVDLQPHQIEAGLFALKSPLSKGVILADEVGLGKTIEAGLVLCQFWAERKRRLLVICPASIRKQWQQELNQKFNLPAMVLDSREYEGLRKRGFAQPFAQDRIVIASYHYASRMKAELEIVPWDLVVLDEAHRLRNARTQASQNLRLALRPVRKLLLTATPLQNSLSELYTLSSFIDERTFGDRESFQIQYSGKEIDLSELRQRLTPIVKRTLRKEVLEYIRFTQRHPLTVTFDPDAPENHLYQEVSEFLQRGDTYSLPSQQRHLMLLILRKILASSSTALTATLDKMRNRLVGLDGGSPPPDMVEDLLNDEALDEEEEEEFAEAPETAAESPVDRVKLRLEIEELGQFISLARSIKVDSKSKALLEGLSKGFVKMKELGGARKALIFTESRRTQLYLKQYLEANGYQGQIVLFNGTNSEPESKAIYDEWRKTNEPLGRASGSRSIDQRTALIEYFRDNATVMLATEAAGEGVNLQFCSLVINYDLPWNPQRIEQRIGRCHRYGQLHDVVVVNFLNAKNDADKRVLELLSEKFHLFKGVFGSSDEVLGTLESGVDFERKVLAIYQQCRSSQEIDQAFQKLQSEMEEQIRSRMQKVRKALLEHFDEEVHTRFRNFMSETQTHLGRIEDMLWRTTKQVLDGRATFNDKKREFQLLDAPATEIRTGPYRLISRSATGQLKEEGEDILYRLSTPLGQHVIERAKRDPAPLAVLTFRITGHATRIMVLERLRKQAGWLTLTKVRIGSLGEEEHNLFAAFMDNGDPIEPETAQRLFSLSASTQSLGAVPREALQRLSTDAGLAVEAQLAKSLQANVAHLNEEQERLERWAEDRKTTARHLYEELEVQLKDTRRQARQATNLKDRLVFKEQEKQLTARQRKAQEEIFRSFEEINKDLESFNDSLQRQLQQSVSTETLFTIRWQVT